MTVALLALALCSPGEAPFSASPPNVVFLISDDQSFTDFGFMGHEHVRTPNLDRLAGEGALFRNGYVPSSLCRPSLVTMLTGLYPHQHLVHFNDPPDKGAGRSAAEIYIREAPSLPRLLAPLGYRSMQTGKFWEGHFSNAGFTDGMTHGDWTRVDRHPKLGGLRGRHGDLGLTIGRDGLEPIARFLDDRGEAPFFLWYAPFLPHEPYHPPERLRKLYEGKGLSDRLVDYYAMCSWFDETVGELRDLLAEKGVADNTLLVFGCDNGWITNESRPRGYMAKSKRSPYDMGVRTPIIFHWPAKIEPAEHDGLVGTVDWAPTVLAAAGVGNERDWPGENLWPLLAGETDKVERDSIFGEIFEHDAKTLGDPAAHLLFRWARRGEYKAILPADDSRRAELYNVAKDPLETVDLADRDGHREILDDLLRAANQWWSPRAEESVVK